MKHVKPVSKAILGPTTGILELIQLLVTLGILNLEDLFKKNNNM